MRFASQAWVEALVAALHRQPDLARALEGLPPTVAMVVERDPPQERTVALWARHAGGRVAEWRILADEDEILELQPATVVRAPYRVWRDLLDGADPVRAALSGLVKVHGDLEALVRRASYRHVATGALAEVPTILPGEARRT